MGVYDDVKKMKARVASLKQELLMELTSIHGFEKAYAQAQATLSSIRRNARVNIKEQEASVAFYKRSLAKAKRDKKYIIAQQKAIEKKIKNHPSQVRAWSKKHPLKILEDDEMF